ncbi:MAG: ABC transporter permease [Gemmatimonadales bacterium]|nr:ABC transporter permease [Gemmatimonadales bacterium]
MSTSGFASALTSLREGIAIALDSLRANKLRAALTILGVAIGVMVVVAMAGTITGINKSVAASFAAASPKTFYVVRFFSGGVHVSDGTEETEPWRRNPPITPEELELIRDLPTVEAAIIEENGSASEVVAGRERATNVNIFGRSFQWVTVLGGDLTRGRTFMALEEAAGDKVVVINEKLAERLFAERNPVGERIRFHGQEYTVIGVYAAPANLFAGPPNQSEIFLPHSTFRRHVPYWPEWADIVVRPTGSATVAEAIDDVTAALRRARRVRPGEENTFATITQDKLLDLWGQLTGVFFAVMLALSSVGLMVGGVGVIAIMMISVTERTREIGVRKALGATRREILWQFLVEAATLTLIGGAVGLAIGWLLSYGVRHFTPVPSTVPLWSVVVALMASALTGIVFGLVPANRASRLDPVEALRYE